MFLHFILRAAVLLQYDPGLRKAFLKHRFWKPEHFWLVLRETGLFYKHSATFFAQVLHIFETEHFGPVFWLQPEY